MAFAGLSYEFRDGVLSLNTLQGDMRLRWEPEPLAEKLAGRGRWAPFMPEFRILAPADTMAATASQDSALQAKNEAFQAFRALMPEALARAVEPFTSHQWALLVLASRVPAAMDLLRSHPVLAYALANNSDLQQRPTPAALHQAARYCHRKHREIAGWLGFPAQDAMSRILGKVPPAIAHPGLLRMLRNATRNAETVKLLGHLPVIHTGVIYLVGSLELAGHVSPKLLLEVAGAEEERLDAPTADLLMDMRSMAGALHAGNEMRRFLSRRKLHEAGERMMERYQAFQAIVRRQREIEALFRQMRARGGRMGPRAEALQIEYDQLNARRPDHPPPRVLLPAPGERPRRGRGRGGEPARPLGPFPGPPIEGAGNIQPIVSRVELRREGQEQQNCVSINSIFADRVCRGDLYFYRILGPARHTLAIARRGSNYWTIEQLKRTGNKPALEGVRSMVQQWLYARQASV